MGRKTGAGARACLGLETVGRPATKEAGLGLFLLPGGRPRLFLAGPSLPDSGPPLGADPIAAAPAIAPTEPGSPLECDFRSCCSHQEHASHVLHLFSFICDSFHADQCSQHFCRNGWCCDSPSKCCERSGIYKALSQSKRGKQAKMQELGMQATMLAAQCVCSCRWTWKIVCELPA